MLPSRKPTIVQRKRAHHTSITHHRLPLLCLAILVIGWIVLQLVLYRSGFGALTADDFGPVVAAADWAQHPYMLWKGPWLPFHLYLIGAPLRLDWEVLWPRVVVLIFGARSMLAIAKVRPRLHLTQITNC